MTGGKTARMLINMEVQTIIVEAMRKASERHGFEKPMDVATVIIQEIESAGFRILRKPRVTHDV